MSAEYAYPRFRAETPGAAAINEATEKMRHAALISRKPTDEIVRIIDDAKNRIETTTEAPPAPGVTAYERALNRQRSKHDPYALMPRDVAIRSICQKAGISAADGEKWVASSHSIEQVKAAMLPHLLKMQEARRG